MACTIPTESAEGDGEDARSQHARSRYRDGATKLLGERREDTPESTPPGVPCSTCCRTALRRARPEFFGDQVNTTGNSEEETSGIREQESKIAWM